MSELDEMIEEIETAHDGNGDRASIPCPCPNVLSSPA
jgi:hypothetical protein